MDPSENSDSGRGLYESTPFGGDDDVTTHYQPVDISEANKVLPGEQEDPRLC